MPIRTATVRERPGGRNHPGQNRFLTRLSEYVRRASTKGTIPLWRLGTDTESTLRMPVGRVKEEYSDSLVSKRWDMRITRSEGHSGRARSRNRFSDLPVW